MTSLRAVDAERIELTDIDLSTCLFAGIHRLDRIRLDGRCVFATGPFGPRRVLAEEQHWRHDNSKFGTRWEPAPKGTDVLDPHRIEALYRQFRKALENDRDEPGAADFYYGEMEMRRAGAATETPSFAHFVERLLLTAYWCTSGYMLRAGRAVSWLLLIIMAVVATTVMWGLPSADRTLTLNGALTEPDGDVRPVTVTVPRSEPAKTIWEQTGKATETTLNAVFFRAPSTELNTVGRYINLVVRILGPVFLTFSVLAFLNRVKR
ncbi:hypothetical protein ABGB12_30060 [Actinocorallia sp. B10E7]|uniref:hypothetical protein n=1 Tax=Actinocorallia sp. B10E7 TaxID=3153558 RepID=UPI00325EBEBE